MKSAYIIAFESLCDERTVKLVEAFADKQIERHEFLEKFEMIMESHRFGLRKEILPETQCGAV